MGAVGLAFLSGILSTLSPCVLPLLPLVLGAAASEHRAGPVALAAGVGSSFAAFGLFVATIGFAIGIDAGAFRVVSAVFMIAISLALIVPGFHARLALAGGPVVNWADRRLGSVSTSSAAGQFCIGMLLGVSWGPCVGPTLGAASLLAAQRTDLAQVAATMFVFGLGASAPLLLLGVLSREVLVRCRQRLVTTSSLFRAGLGLLLMLIGIAILTGIDRRIEVTLVKTSPQWLTNLTTRF